MRWKFTQAREQNPWIVQLLNDKQQVVPFATERFFTKPEAIGRAKFLNKNAGVNVQVLCEHAYCINDEED